MSLEERLFVRVDDVSYLEYEDKVKIQMFNWTFSELTQTSLQIDIDFEYPEMIGFDNSSQYIEVYALFSDFEPMWNNSKPLIRKLVPD